MKSLKINLLTLIACLAASVSFGAAAPAAADSVGQIKAFMVTGSASVRNANGQTTPLVRNDLVPVGSTIITGDTGGVLLVFSNGAAMQIKPNSEVGITKFEQAAFDTQGGQNTFIRLNADPSKSTTELDLQKGTLAGEVKKLNQAAGSQFTVNTPAGSAGIRGTIPSFTVERDGTGKVISVTIACAEGTVSFKPNTISNLGRALQTNSVNVEQGGQVKLAISTDANNNIISLNILGSSYSGAEAQQVLNDLYAVVNQVRADQGLAPLVTPTAAPPSKPTNNQGPIQGQQNPNGSTPNTNPTVISE